MNVSGSDGINVNLLLQKARNLQNKDFSKYAGLETTIMFANRDDNEIIDKNEMQDLISSLRMKYQDKYQAIMQELGLNSDGSLIEAVDGGPVDNLNPSTLNGHKPPEFPDNEYLSQDKAYQGYKNTLLKWDAEMAKIEAEYGISDNERWQLGLSFYINDKEVEEKYTQLQMKYKDRAKFFENYPKAMENWKDGGNYQRTCAGINYYNISRVTINGQHLYSAIMEGETEPKLYYPRWDGEFRGDECSP